MSPRVRQRLNFTKCERSVLFFASLLRGVGSAVLHRFVGQAETPLVRQPSKKKHLLFVKKGNQTWWSLPGEGYKYLLQGGVIRTSPKHDSKNPISSLVSRPHCKCLHGPMHGPMAMHGLLWPVASGMPAYAGSARASIGMQWHGPVHGPAHPPCATENIRFWFI